MTTLKKPHLRPLPAGRMIPSPPTPATVVVGGSSVEAWRRVVEGATAAAALEAAGVGTMKPCVSAPAAAKARAQAWSARRVEGMVCCWN